MITTSRDPEVANEPAASALDAASLPTAASTPSLAASDTLSHAQCEQLFVESLPLIRRAVASVAWRYHLSADEAEEFESVVELRIISDGYAVFHKFRGRSGLRTFLTVVIQRMFLDYREKQWGKWRPSIKSRRNGTAAILLERLTMRDGLTFDEAYAALEATHSGPLDRQMLEDLHARLRRRSRPRVVSDQQLEDIPTTRERPDAALVAAENAAVVEKAITGLAAALAPLASEDRMILRLRFFEGRPIAEIARLLGLDQKQLYVRLARLMRRLRTRLESVGVSGADVLAALHGGDGVHVDVFHGSKESYEARRRSPLLRDGVAPSDPAPYLDSDTIAIVA
jgi:RNA polymerase sigma factor for flagellar operon FliA